MNKTLYIVGILAVLITGMIILTNATTEPIIEGEVETRPRNDWTVVEITSATDPTVDAPDTESVTEAITDPSETVTETESLTESSTTSYYNVNLSAELQNVIFTECEKYGIMPSIVIAMIEKESRFDRYAMGDDGRSFGLMQIQPKWHLRLMVEMGCTDLFDPVQNIKVGVAILESLKMCYNDVGIALTYYNSGKTGLNDYAKAILARANEI